MDDIDYILYHLIECLINGDVEMSDNLIGRDDSDGVDGEEHFSRILGIILKRFSFLLRWYLWSQHVFNLEACTTLHVISLHSEAAISDLSVCLVPILVGWLRVTRIHVTELPVYPNQLLPYDDQHLVRLIGIRDCFVRSLHFICIDYSVVKSGCGVSSDSPTL